jgi:GNAT superfamily N-acetyltransferase
MRIVPLADSPHFLPLIVAQLHADWGSLPPWSDPHVVLKRLEKACDSAPFPRAFVAVSDQGEFLGTASIKLNELRHHPDKTHWLGEVYVPKECRGRGIGTQLIEAAANYAFQEGALSLFLYTPDQQKLYAKLGWQPVGTEIVNGEPVTVMVRRQSRVRC